MRKGRKSRLLIVLAGLFGIAALVGASVLGAVCVCSALPYDARPSDCMIVLGAHVWMDGHMSGALQFRCDRALEGWREGIAPAIIVCGGQGDDEPTTEAEAMRAWLTAQGVPDEAVYLDDTSVNTRENLEHARAIMAANGFRTAAICTNSYHLRRALWLAGDVGIDACGLSARSLTTVSSVVRNYIRESISWVLYFLRKL